MTKRIAFIFLAFSTLLAAFGFQAGRYLHGLMLRDSDYEWGQGWNWDSPAGKKSLLD